MNFFKICPCSGALPAPSIVTDKIEHGMFKNVALRPPISRIEQLPAD